MTIVTNPPLDQPTISKIRKATNLGFQLEAGSTDLVITYKKDRYYFPCDTMIWSGKYDGGIRLPPETLKGHFSEALASNEIVATFAAFLKKGDIIQAYWLEGNNNGYIEEAVYQPQIPMPGYTRLYRDELRVRVYRSKGPTSLMHLHTQEKVKVTKCYTFLLAVGICADDPKNPNNIARLCRR